MGRWENPNIWSCNSRWSIIWGCIYFTKIKKRYPLALFVDLIIPSILIGQVFGRWGNFFNGEVFGKLVDRDTLWWIPSFITNNATTGNFDSMGGLAHIGNQAGYDQVNLPLFFIESIINTIGFIFIGIVLWKFWKKYRKPFDLGFIYFVWYGSVRLILEPLRVPKFNMPTSMGMSVAFVVIGIIGLILTRIIFKNKNFANMYINEAAEKMEQLEIEKKEAELQAKIEAKKAEIRARRVKENN